MKYLMALLPVALLASSISFAGPISAGGPVKSLFRAVCFTLGDNPNVSLEIFVGFADKRGKNQVLIDDLKGTAPNTLIKLIAQQAFTQQVGENETYRGKNFGMNIKADTFLPAGAGLDGSYSVTVGKKTFEGRLGCQLFTK